MGNFLLECYKSKDLSESIRKYYLIYSRLLAQHLQTCGGESSDSAVLCASAFTEQAKSFPTCSKVACRSLFFAVTIQSADNSNRAQVFDSCWTGESSHSFKSLCVDVHWLFWWKIMEAHQSVAAAFLGWIGKANDWQLKIAPTCTVGLPWLGFLLGSISI